MAILDIFKRLNSKVRSSESGTIVLTSADARAQVFNPTANTIVKLPYDINAGEEWTITNQSSTYFVIVQSSDGTQLAKITRGHYSTISLQNNPTSSSHWQRKLTSGLVKYQIKKLVTNFPSTGTMTDLSFNLEVGKTYRITLNIQWGDANGEWTVYFRDSGTDFNMAYINSGSTAGENKMWSNTTVRAMTGGALTFYAVKSGTATLNGNNTLTSTHVIVEELPDHQLTTEW